MTEPEYNVSASSRLVLHQLVILILGKVIQRNFEKVTEVLVVVFQNQYKDLYYISKCSYITF